MTDTITRYNGASEAALAMIDSIEPPYASWTAWREGFDSPHAYRLRAEGITTGAICGPMGSDVIGEVVFTPTGDPVSFEVLARLDSGEYAQGVPLGWQQCHDYRVVRDLLRALTP